MQRIFNKMTMTQLRVNGVVLVLCFASVTCQIDGWKPILGSTSYSHLTQQLPSPAINVENGDSIGENSVTFHGTHLIGANAVEDPIQSAGGSISDAGTEGRILGDISSDYGSSSKVFNGLYSTGGVSVNFHTIFGKFRRVHVKIARLFCFRPH